VKQVIRWTPDTCGCVIEYEVGGVQALTATKCGLHQHLDDAHYLEVVMKENRVKNMFHGTIVEQLPEILTEDGLLPKDSWGYEGTLQSDGSRRFFFDTTNLTGLQKEKINTLTVNTSEGVKSIIDHVLPN
jgi:hypothetical protein